MSGPTTQTVRIMGWERQWEEEDSEKWILNSIDRVVYWRAASLLFGYVVAVAVGLNVLVHFEMHIVFNKFAERKSIERGTGDTSSHTMNARTTVAHTSTIAGSLSSFHFHLSLSTKHIHGPVQLHGYVILVVLRQTTRCCSLCPHYRWLWHLHSPQLRAHTAPTIRSYLTSVAVIHHKYFPNDT